LGVASATSDQTAFRPFIPNAELYLTQKKAAGVASVFFKVQIKVLERPAFHLRSGGAFC